MISGYPSYCILCTSRKRKSNSQVRITAGYTLMISIVGGKLHSQLQVIGPLTVPQILNRLYRLYQHVFDRMHSRTKALKLYYHHNDKEVILGWVSHRESTALVVAHWQTYLSLSLLFTIDHIYLWTLCCLCPGYAEICHHLTIEPAFTMDQEKWRQSVYPSFPCFLVR